MRIPLPHRSKLAGQAVVVETVDDLPLARFAEGLPTMSTPTGSAASLWERWCNELVSRSLVQPSLTPTQVDQLGAVDRGAILNALTHAWGLPGAIGAVPSALELYTADFRRMLRRMSRRTGRLPTELLAMSAREFWTNYVILFGPDTAPTERDVLEAMWGASDG